MGAQDLYVLYTPCSWWGLSRPLRVNTNRQSLLNTTVATGAAASQCVTPRGVRHFWGLWGGGGCLDDPNLGGWSVGQSAAGLPGGGGGGVGGYPNIHTSK